MSSIFVSYRRGDSQGWAGRIVADLRRAFPEMEVFHDIAAVPPGADFVQCGHVDIAETFNSIPQA